MSGLSDAECEALFACEPPAGMTRRDQIEQIVARHVEAFREQAVARLLAFDCVTDAEQIPSWIDVPDDYEGGLHDAARIVRNLDP